MLDGMFVFDGAVHVLDLSDDNLRPDAPDARAGRDWVVKMAAGGLGLPVEEFIHRFTLEEAYSMIFEESSTDMALAMVVPTWWWFKDAASPIATQHAFSERYPERVIFCGGVDPLSQGLVGATESIDYQVKELGARSIKFYNGHPNGGWRCDDRKLAYPMYERVLELGLRSVQFHKGFPFGLMNVEETSPTDLQAPARDFPELDFIVHHLGIPYFDEMVWIANRFPNIYLNLGQNIDMGIVAPRLVQEQLGRLLMEVGSHKLIWASDAVLAGRPQPYLEWFRDMEIPEDLRSGYGYPQITRADKEAILGLNLARLLGVDVEAKLTELEVRAVA